MSRLVRDLFHWFALTHSEPVVARAQLDQLRRQVPLMYGLLLINSAAVCLTFWDKAPALLTFSVPVALFPATVARMIWWLRATMPTELGPIRRRLRGITLFGMLFGMTYITWAFSMAQYGGSFEQAHIALYIATTVIGCIFCLVHLPQAALVVSTCVLPVFVMRFVDNSNPVSGLIALNILLVLLVLLRVMFNSFGGFRRECLAKAELVRLNAENRVLALTDGLTGMGNRRLFYSDLADATARPENIGALSVGLMDLNRFKAVNDTFGHHVGDQLLAEVARRLQATVGPWATLYRLGGDEFAAIMHAAPAACEALAERMCQAAEAPVRLADRQISVGASIGLASLSEAGLGPSELAERADYALYSAKNHQLGGTVCFSDELQLEIGYDNAIEVELRSSSMRDELDIQVQPVVDCRTGEVVAGEILVRWDSPLLGKVDPGHFIRLAERSSLIHQISLEMIGRALRLLSEVPKPVYIAVNLSACDLNTEQTVAAMLKTIGASREDPARLCIEVTETAVMRNMQQAISSLARLRALGLKVALDDFGTGYSSLGNLSKLPLDVVKIDRSFAQDLDSVSSRSIAEAVIGLCDRLALTCVAEGVETEEEARIFSSMGCRLMQGYYFGKPIAPEAFTQLCTAGPLANRVAA